jgi:hypothetical protein
MTPVLDGTVTKPVDGWGVPDLPSEPGAVLRCRTLQGARIIAALADTSLWRVQYISAHGGILQWSWTPAALAGNLWEADSYEIIAAP